MNETKQVPVEPTDEMVDEAMRAHDEYIRDNQSLRVSIKVMYEAMLAAAPATDHPAHTHCANCGCTWLDNGLNPAWCPYCKATEPSEVERLAKAEAVAFFRWWWNQTGSNTEQGYDQWVSKGKPGVVRVRGEKS